MSASVPLTARDTLHDLALLVSKHGLPTPPSPDVVYALQLAAEIAGELPLSVADVATGLMLLEQSRAADEAPDVAAHRRICSALCDLIGPTTPGMPARLAAVLRAVERVLFGSADTREATTAAYARIMAAQIEEVFGVPGMTGTLTWQADRSRWLLQIDRLTAPIVAGPPADPGATGEQLLPAVQSVLAEAGLLARRPVIDIVDPAGRPPYADALDIPTSPGGYVMGSLITFEGALTVAVPMGGTVTAL